MYSYWFSMVCDGRKNASIFTDNCNGFYVFSSRFPEMPPGWCKFLSVYKVLRTGFPGIAKCCFTNGFLDFLICTFGASATRRGPPQRGLAARNINKWTLNIGDVHLNIGVNLNIVLLNTEMNIQILNSVLRTLFMFKRGSRTVAPRTTIPLSYYEAVP